MQLLGLIIKEDIGTLPGAPAFIDFTLCPHATSRIVEVGHQMVDDMLPDPLFRGEAHIFFTQKASDIDLFIPNDGVVCKSGKKKFIHDRWLLYPGWDSNPHGAMHH